MDVVCCFTPNEPLDWYYYTATLDGSLADRRGNEMGEDFVWEFGYWDVKESSWGRIKAEY